MERPSAFAAIPALMLLMLLIAAAPFPAQNKEPAFTPPEMATASDMVYPVDSVASGIVVVAVRLDAAGTIKGTDVLRDIPSLTSPVLLAIQDWTFKPAMLDNKGVDSTIVISLVFNPKDYLVGGTAAPVLGKELRVLSPDAAGFLPPKTISAPWAVYPADSVMQGAVILDVRVGPRGKVTDVTSVWKIQPLTDTAIDAAKNWTFSPATFHGTPVAANEVVGYVFRVTNLAKPPGQR